MPELPEVETTRRGIAPFLEGTTIRNIIIRHHQLRWPIPENLKGLLADQRVHRVSRRAKYLLIQCDKGYLIIHLGMSGSLKILSEEKAQIVKKHDHIDIINHNGDCLRYNDPRRFGAILWTDKPLEQHALLAQLGPEPLSDAFNTSYLKQQIKSRKCRIKSLIMNNHIVVGVGNIYANESLFLAGIHPDTVVSKLSTKRCQQLVESIKFVLERAIAAGGTTLKDFTNSEGQPGYFQQQLNVYGREAEPCLTCQSLIHRSKNAKRATYYCPLCQKKS